MENEIRIIVLHDCDTDFLVETDAPKEEIELAIAHKNDMLCLNLPFRSDFEEMQEYLNDKGYYLEEIGYVNDLETYNW